MTFTVVGIGGSLRVGSQSERALRIALRGAAEAGARTLQISGHDLLLPFYDPVTPRRTTASRHLVEALRRADGVVLVSPAYHGTVSGLVKNALDYVEDLRNDARPYLEGRAVGCVAAAQGSQAAVNTLSTLRAIAHSLRAWPTPLGVSIDSTELKLPFEGSCPDVTLRSRLQLVGQQVVEFAQARRQAVSVRR
ncbi:FMN reductase [Longimycelium tulufanense]|uniref:FMN reductase n=1 Tax=Longimycelium tulufanense TaxID=907463 RepID=A0A8J3FZF9_9PSEU|nr:NAD(P)H-dependent oxidoreductase [Longimycelium tulufanense]GGM84299.1 FMN reductase [Longimycelium tulufanense]